MFPWEIWGDSSSCSSAWLWLHSCSQRLFHNQLVLISKVTLQPCQAAGLLSGAGAPDGGQLDPWIQLKKKSGNFSLAKIAVSKSWKANGIWTLHKQ